MRRSRQKLVEALRRTALGDTAAFETVYRATSSKLYGIIVRMLGRGALADKVLQKVFVRMWQRAGEFP
jgi:RNA polymerase sigma-70 factor (ECF subfamily)